MDLEVIKNQYPEIKVGTRAEDLISVTIPVIPLKKHCSLLIFLISVSASIASSDEVVLSNKTDETVTNLEHMKTELEIIEYLIQKI